MLFLFFGRPLSNEKFSHFFRHVNDKFYDNLPLTHWRILRFPLRLIVKTHLFFT